MNGCFLVVKNMVVMQGKYTSLVPMDCLGYPPVNKHSNGKSPSWIGNTSSNGGFSISMLDYRSVLSNKPTSLQPEPFFVPRKKGAATASAWLLKSLALAESEHLLLNPMAVMSFCSGRKKRHTHTLFFYCCVFHIHPEISRDAPCMYIIYKYIHTYIYIYG